MAVSLVKTQPEFDDDTFDSDFAWLDEYEEDFAFSAVEQGMYDDDPSPYNGDYSEM
jgi:hypothetical protein